jgi:hypothetical protein
MKLTKDDYINILEYYNIKINKNLSFSSLKKLVEKIIAEKLCSCIKKVPNENQPESRAIGICNYSVVKRKNLKINGFTCKKKKMLKTAKFNKNRLTKTIRNKLSLIVKRKSSKGKSSKRKSSKK